MQNHSDEWLGHSLAPPLCKTILRGKSRSGCVNRGLILEMPAISFTPWGMSGFSINLALPDLWQQEAVRHLQARKDVIVDAPTGAGKTHIFELMVKGNAIIWEWFGKRR